jgi:WD40 repeat protein
MQPDLKSKDTSTILWNLGTGRERERFQGQVAGEFSPDGKYIVTFSARPSKVETTYQYSNSETGEVTPHKSVVSVIRFDNAAIWETYTGRQLVKAKLDEHNDPKWHTLHFSPDGRRFVHIGSDAVLYDTSDGRELGRIGLRFKRFLRYTSSGALASCHTTLTERWFKLIDIESSREIRSIEHDLKRTDDFAWTHDGSKVVVIPSRESAIKILDIESEKMITGATTGPYPKRTAIISPDNRRLAIAWGGSYVDQREVEPGLGIYDVSTGEEIARLKLAKLGHVVGFSPDSTTLLIGGAEFVIYNAENGEEIRTLNLLGDANLDRGSE